MVKFFTVVAVILFTSCELLLGAFGGLSHGVYRGSESWVFLEKFVFNSRAVSKSGFMENSLIFPADDALKLMVYFLGSSDDSEFTSWNDIYYGHYTCEEKLLRSNYHFDLQEPQFQRRTFELDGVEYKEVTVKSSFDTSRARWFFIAVGNCKPSCSDEYCSAGVDVEYNFNLTNGGGVDMYFSADEQGILQMDVFYTVLYAFVVIYALYIRQQLLAIRKYHVTVILLVSSVSLSLVSKLCETISFTKYSYSGFHLSGALTISAICEGAAEFCMVLHVILVAKGWTIVRRKISAMGRVRIAIYMTFYVCWYWACMIYYQYGVGKESITYVFDTWPGHGVVALRCWAFLWLQYAIRVTVRKYRSKKRFYFKYAILVGIWVLSLPFFVMLNWSLPEYVRAKVLKILNMTSLFFLQLSLVLLYSPSSRFKSEFPFHVTTAAMLAGRRTSAFTSGDMKDSHLRQAAALSQRIRDGISALEQYSADLNDFLDAVDPTDDDHANKDEDFDNNTVHSKLMHSSGKFGSNNVKSLPKSNIVPPLP